MTRYIALALTAWMTVVPAAPAAEPEVPELTHNPFDRPVLVTAVSRGSERGRSGSWPFVLQATLRSSAGSLANVGGRLIALGEEYEGYRLIRVGEGTATFRKDGVDIKLAVGKRDDDEDDT